MTAVQYASTTPHSARPARPTTRNVPPPPLAPNVRQRPGTAATPSAPQPPRQPVAAPQPREDVAEPHLDQDEAVAFLTDDSAGTGKPGRNAMVAGAVLLAVGLVVAMVAYAVAPPWFVLLPVAGAPVLAALCVFGYGLVGAARNRRRR